MKIMLSTEWYCNIMIMYKVVQFGLKSIPAIIIWMCASEMTDNAMAAGWFGLYFSSKTYMVALHSANWMACHKNLLNFTAHITLECGILSNHGPNTADFIMYEVKKQDVLP